MSQYYEIVAFSIGFPNHLNKLIELIDKKHRIQYRLFRHHAIKSYGIYYKDMSRLGRDLSKVILLDVHLDKLSK
jgi:TFIIF-interacting CTD phosphatase-like protein